MEKIRDWFRNLHVPLTVDVFALLVIAFFLVFMAFSLVESILFMINPDSGG